MARFRTGWVGLEDGKIQDWMDRTGGWQDSGLGRTRTGGWQDSGLDG